MKVVVFTLGALQLIAAILILIGSASAIHEVLSAVLFGMGAVCLGLGGILAHLEKIIPSRLNGTKDKQEVKNLMHIDKSSKRGWKAQQ